MNKEEIKDYITKNYYDLDFDYEKLRKEYKFNELCQTTVPQALYCFHISENFEDTIRTGILFGGDSDTLCAIAGSVAEAYYGIDEKYIKEANKYLDNRLLKIVKKLNNYTKKSLCK